jgi:hypothetical protein
VTSDTTDTCRRLGIQDAIWDKPPKPEEWWDADQTSAYQDGHRWATEQLAAADDTPQT